MRLYPWPRRRRGAKENTWHELKEVGIQGCTGLGVLGQQPKSGGGVNVTCEQSHDRDTTLACIYTFGLIRYGGVGYPCVSGVLDRT